MTDKATVDETIDGILFVSAVIVGLGAATLLAAGTALWERLRR